LENLISLIVIFIKICLIVYTVQLANESGRSRLRWVIVAIFVSGILSVILLKELSEISYTDYEYSALTEPTYFKQNQNMETRKTDSAEDISKNKTEKIVTGREFYNYINRYYSMYKNDYISKDEFQRKKENYLNNLKEAFFNENGQDFIFETIDLVEQNILTKEELDSIKELIDNKRLIEEKQDTELIDMYNEGNNDLIKYELIRRNIDIENLEIEKQNREIDGYKLMREYIETKDQSIIKELQRRDIYNDDLLRKVKILASLRNIDLMVKYLNENDEMIIKEMKHRNLPLDKKDIIKSFDNITLIDYYRETGDKVARDELIDRGLEQYV
jgi:hypothetical protein